MRNKPEYTRRLPHYHPVGGIFFITFRLYGSLPIDFLHALLQWAQSERLRISALPNEVDRENAQAIFQRDYFRKYDHALDQCLFGPTFLKDPAAAYRLVEQLTRFDGHWYDLLAYTIMPNHAHVLLDFSAQTKDTPDPPLYKNLDHVMNFIKGASARYINLAMGRSSQPCWQPEYHDRYIRDRRHLLGAVDYIKQNPVSGRICKHWREHPFTWIHERFW
jgi:REP element-mobilizing transposase RayT